MSSSYAEKLLQSVMENSESNDWDTAVLEWDIYDCEEDESLNASCVCGKEKLRYLYTIRNRNNCHFLNPIGSSCIKMFGREDLNTEMSVQEGLFKLLHSIQSRQFISLTTEFFSRKIIQALYEDNAFNTSYNNYKGERDYNFFVQMFNKRDKSSITQAQHKKIRAIIVSSLKPYLERKLKDKIRITNH